MNLLRDIGLMEIAKTHQDRLKDIKKNIERASVYFKPNNQRYHKFQKFVFETSVSEDEKDTLLTMGKPVIEFNITNAPISRLCGEFSKQEPSIYVSADNGTPIDPETLEVVEGHIRHILFDAKKHNTQYNVYRDQLSGGFSDFKVWTEYAGEMSFDQVIRFGRTFDPTLTGYDPMAREVDKSDAEFCFEVFPMPKGDFKRNYPNVDIDQCQFINTGSGFDWTYQSSGEDVVVVVDYYEKKKKKVQIVKTADNKVMTADDYKTFLLDWQASGIIEQPPAMVGEPRWTEKVYICRYRVMVNNVLEYKETSFKNLPLVFVDGDSVVIKTGEGGSMQQFTKPYVYHAEGIQKLTNFSGQVIANDFENMVMHKFKVAEESLPDQAEFRDAYTQWQIPNTLVYKHLYNDDPNTPLPPPQEIARVPLPPEVVNTFNTSMQMLQNILGSYDASLGINDNQLSGVAIVEGATQSNAAAMPYIVNYMQSLNQVATIILDLIPKYYKTPRTIPIIGKDGKPRDVKVNEPNGQGIQFNYDENVLKVKVEAGVNFSIAKNKALQQLIALQSASPQFAEFIAEEGLETLLDNMEFRNVDVLKAKVEKWVQKKAKQKAEQPDPEQIKAQLMQQQMQDQQMQFAAQMKQNEERFQIEIQKMNQKREEAEAKALLETERLLIDKEKADNDRLKIMADAGQSHGEMIVSLAKAEAEETRAEADLRIKHIDIAHSHARAVADHHMAKEDQKHRHMKESVEVGIKHHTATKEPTNFEGQEND